MSKVRLSSCKCISLTGIDGSLVNVEAHISDGLPRFDIVGLPDTSVSESKSRVITSFRSTGVFLSDTHIVVNLAPAALPKRGSHYDLAISIAVLGAYGILNRTKIKSTVLIGEIGLDGRIHPVRGILPMVVNAKKCGIKQVVVPAVNETEAKLVEDVDIISFEHLYQVANYFGAELPSVRYEPIEFICRKNTSIKNYSLDMSDVIGQVQAKQALEVAAAGLHNILLIGPPGTGKSMLAARLPSILPELDFNQALETTSIQSVAGFGTGSKLITTPPFESPHHTSTAPAIIGGGSGVATPGSVSRAHNGILFLDEAPEFSPRVLQTLRQPLEAGEVVIERAQGKATYPARFQLVLAANPCPCGMLSAKSSTCQCTSLQQRRYFNKLSGPLLDRIDIRIWVSKVGRKDLQSVSEKSGVIRERVLEARQRAKHRLRNTLWTTNSQVPGSYLRRNLPLSDSILENVNESVERGILSLRGADRVLRLSWTLADLKGESKPRYTEIATALSLRSDDFGC